MKTLNWKTGVILGVIILVAIFFRTWNIVSFDISGDATNYSFRSLGWLDFMAGEGQIGPVEWAGEAPSWAGLSFQDAPPLVFALQHASFRLLGDNTFAARLPFLLAGLLMLVAVFFLVRKYADLVTALIASGILAISSYAVWASLAGYLEGVLALFLVLSLYFVIPWLAGGSKKSYLWPVFVGLALLSKYTALFLLPAAFVSFLFLQKRLEGSGKGMPKRLIISLVILLVVLSPVIIYNFQMYQARGHFDSALSSLVGISSKDFAILGERHASLDILANFTNFVRILASANSLPYLLLATVALAWLIVRAVKKRNSLFENVLLVHTLMLVLMFAFSSGNAVRLLSIVTPLLSIVTALFVVWGYRRWGKGFLALAAVILLCETFYSVNTNILVQPVGSTLLYSQSRLYDRGWNKLSDYIETQIFTEDRPMASITKAQDIMSISEPDIRGKNVLLYDERLSWFALSWYINKHLIYYKSPVFKVSALGEQIGGLGFRDYLSKKLGSHVYFLSAVDESVLDKVKKDGQVSESIKKYITALENSKTSFTEILGPDGRVMFRIYQLN